MSKRTITLTGRSPVTIDDDNWPCIAEASDSQHDGQVECQANRKSKWWIKVRQHTDGRAIVYAGYSYDSNWQNARSYAIKNGQLLTQDSTAQAICNAIKDVAAEMEDAECNSGDELRWPTLAAECIADMPAEELA